MIETLSISSLPQAKTADPKPGANATLIVNTNDQLKKSAPESDTAHFRNYVYAEAGAFPEGVYTEF